MYAKLGLHETSSMRGVGYFTRICWKCHKHGRARNSMCKLVFALATGNYSIQTLLSLQLDSREALLP